MVSPHKVYCREGRCQGKPNGAIRVQFKEVFFHGRLCRYYSRGGRTDVIYLIYKDGEILVETDDLEFVRTYMTKNQECSVRDARTGKKIPLE
jgi:hypothetical protein